MPPFNPSIGQVSLYPLANNKATLGIGMAGGNTPTGQAIGYLRWVLYAYCGWNGTGGKANLHPLANWGPWTMSGSVVTGLQGIEALFGRTPTGIASHVPGSGQPCSSWYAVDQVWLFNN